MPIYGYICKSCEHTLDALQKISDDPLVYCPDCGEPQLKKQLSAPRFRLKGKGWYETDFKTENQRNLHGDKETSKKSDKPDSKKPGKDAPASKTTSAAGD
jgi:putative FmdB family regulatory protein